MASAAAEIKNANRSSSRAPHTSVWSGPGRSTRPSLSALPGFRTHPDNASQERAGRQQHSSGPSTDSNSSSAATSQCKMQSRRSRSAHQSIDLGNVFRSSREKDFGSPPTTAIPSFSSPFSTKTVPDRVEARQRQRHSQHGRSGSVAASFVSTFAPKHFPGKRRASTSLLDDALPDTAASSSQASAPRTASSATFDHDRADTKSTGTGSRHRRSRTGLRHGSAKILNWMDGAAPSPAPASSTGLGLDFVQKGYPHVDSKQADVPESLPGSLRGSKGLAKLKSFGIRPGFRRGWSETLLPNSALEPDATLHPLSTTRGGIDQSPGLNKPSTASKGMSRASSFLNLSIMGFNSQRDRSISRQSSTASFRVTDEPRTSSLSTRATHNEHQAFNNSMADMSDTSLFKAPVLPASVSMSGLDADSSIVVHDRPVQSKKPSRTVKTAGSAVDRLGLFRRTPTPSSRELPKEPNGEVGDVTVTAALCSSSPPTSPVLVERILPPEQIIDMLDRLRIVDPSGRARDILGATGRSPLLDAGLALPPSVFSSSSDSHSMADASFVNTATAGTAWEAPSSWRSNCSSPTLGSESVCATPTAALWSSTPVPPPRLPLLRGNSHDNQGNTRSSHVDPCNPNPRLRSLPAPPRKAKRRPQTSSDSATSHEPTTVPVENAFTTPVKPVPQTFNPLSDISNQPRRSSADRSASLDFKYAKDPAALHGLSSKPGPRPLRSPQRPRPRSTVAAMHDQPAIICVAPSPVL